MRLLLLWSSLAFCVELPTTPTPVPTPPEVSLPADPPVTVREVPEAPVTAGPMMLADLFSAEQNPGRGTFEYVKSPTDTLKVTLGSETGHYLLGMVFPNDTLPDGVRADFRKKEVIQLAFGTLNKATAGRIGQFGAVTLCVKRTVRAERTIPLRIPGGPELSLLEYGLLLFSPPDLQAQGSDEEKLKSTLFARSGAVILRAISKPSSIQVTAGGRKNSFKMQAMHMDIQAALGTPFSNEEHQLKASDLEFPLYWPDGPTGKTLVRKLAEASFNSQSTIHIPREYGPKERQITGGPPSRRK